MEIWEGEVLGCERREYRQDVYQQLWEQIRELDLWEAAPLRGTPHLKPQGTQVLQ